MDRCERRYRTEVAIAAQLRIAKKSAVPGLFGALVGPDVNQPGRLRKRHAGSCGNTRCGICGNPRKNGSKERLTIQELRHADAMRQGIEAAGLDAGLHATSSA